MAQLALLLIHLWLEPQVYEVGLMLRDVVRVIRRRCWTCRWRSTTALSFRCPRSRPLTTSSAWKRSTRASSRSPRRDTPTSRDPSWSPSPPGAATSSAWACRRAASARRRRSLRRQWRRRTSTFASPTARRRATPGWTSPTRGRTPASCGSVRSAPDRTRTRPPPAGTASAGRTRWRAEAPPSSERPPSGVPAGRWNSRCTSCSWCSEWPWPCSSSTVSCSWSGGAGDPDPKSPDRRRRTWTGSGLDTMRWRGTRSAWNACGPWCRPPSLEEEVKLYCICRILTIFITILV